MHMARKLVGLLVGVIGACLMPVGASAHASIPASDAAGHCDSFLHWKSVQFPTAPPVPGGQRIRVQGGPDRLYARAYESKVLGAHPVLVVVLHGDGPPPYQFPSYQHVFASKVAAENRNVVAVGLLRPGYTDPQGHHSQGCSGQRDGDRLIELPGRPHNTFIYPKVFAELGALIQRVQRRPASPPDHRTGGRRRLARYTASNG